MIQAVQAYSTHTSFGSPLNSCKVLSLVHTIITLMSSRHLEFGKIMEVRLNPKVGCMLTLSLA